MSDKRDMPDAEQLKEILNTVSSEIPKLLEAISGILYGQENATKFGKSVAQFYKELVDAGMTTEQAYQLTRDYMKNFSLGGMISSAFGGMRGHDDIGDVIKDKIRGEAGKS